MRRISYHIVAGLFGVTFAMTGCGDNSRECGVGTELVGGVCQGNQCAAGTIPDNAGNCVPDGETLCTDGTTFDTEAGVCRPDINACGAGLVNYEGECRDPADVPATYDEAAEPNDGAAGLAVDIAAEGGSITIKGCVDPVGGAMDGDTYIINTTGPTLLHVAVDGYNGLSGGFMMNSGAMMLSQNGWIRYGVDLFDDTADREVFLPMAGEFWLTVTDGRSILTNEPAGNGETCYLATVTTMPQPTPTPIAGTATGLLTGQAEFYEYITVESDIVFADAQAPSNTVLIDAVVLANGAYFDSASGDFEQRPLGSPADALVSGTAADEQVLVVVDPVIDYGIDDVDYSLTVNSARPAPLPSDGSTIPVLDNGIDSRYLYFDVDGGDVIHLRFAADAPGGLSASIVDLDLNEVAALCDLCASVDEYIYFTDTARYYLQVTDRSDPVPPSIQLTADRIHHTPSALNVGTNLSNETLAADGSAFYTMDFNQIDWVAFDGAGINDFLGDLQLDFFGRRAGILNSSLDVITLTGGTDVGRIFEAGSQFLVHASDNRFLTGTPGTFDISVAQRPHNRMNPIVDSMTPSEVLGVPYAMNGFDRYLIEVPVFTQASVSVIGAGAFDTMLTILDRTEGTVSFHDSTLDGEAEVADVIVGPGPYIAFAVEEWQGNPGNYDVTVGGTLPALQVVAGNLPYNDVCAMGEVLPTDSTDDGGTDFVTLPFAFEHLGTPQLGFYANTNGYATFDPASADPSNAWIVTAIPTPGIPDNFIAPFWADITDVQICYYATPTHATIQWEGRQFGGTTPAQMQLVLHEDRSMDFIYSGGHGISSADSVIGLDNAAGDGGFPMANEVAGFANPGSSWTLIPN